MDLTLKDKKNIQIKTGIDWLGYFILDYQNTNKES